MVLLILRVEVCFDTHPYIGSFRLHFFVGWLQFFGWLSLLFGVCLDALCLIQGLQPLIDKPHRMFRVLELGCVLPQGPELRGKDGEIQFAIHVFHDCIKLWENIVIWFEFVLDHVQEEILVFSCL